MDTLNHDRTVSGPITVTDQNWKGDAVPLVTISCITYNHESYIRDAIEGFLHQITSFPIEILIHDDASTDGTASIIREYEQEYPGLILPIYQSENQYSRGVRISPTYQFPRARGKYIALCEGDDYWTDPLKLQKQVDFLDKHSEYSLCCGGYEILDVNTGEMRVVNKCYQGMDSIGFSFGLEDMQRGWLTKTLTVLFREAALRDYEKHQYQYRFSRDIHLFYHLAKVGKGFYFNCIFGVYRVHKGGINSANRGKNNYNVAYQCYQELYEQNRDEFSRQMYLKHILMLFRYDLYHPCRESTMGRKMKLLSEAFYLARGWKEFGWIAKSFLPQQRRL